MTPEEFLLENGYDEKDQCEGYILTVKELVDLLGRYSYMEVSATIHRLESFVNK